VLIRDEPGFFEVVRNVSSVRRLRSTPLPQRLIEEILDLAVCVPSGVRKQPWSFVVLQKPATKRFFAGRYMSALNLKFARNKPALDDPSSRAASIRAAFELGASLHNVPVIILVCGLREWPHGIAVSGREITPPASLEATLPCVQNILLAASALGLGASVTTLHLAFEQELAHYLDIPSNKGIVAAIPLGYPVDAPTKAPPRSARQRTRYDGWRLRSPTK
jgi:nitroreductase